MGGLGSSSLLCRTRISLFCTRLPLWCTRVVLECTRYNNYSVQITVTISVQELIFKVYNLISYKVYINIY